jgi:hypothetical protein
MRKSPGRVANTANANDSMNRDKTILCIVPLPEMYSAYEYDKAAAQPYTFRLKPNGFIGILD